eukprot:Platyproteum_vivax@DN8897_c0_g1_i1.p1
MAPPAAAKAKPTKGKRQAENLNTQIQLVVKSGKILMGYKSALKAIRNSKAKLLITATNMPPLRRSEIDYYAMLGKVDVHAYHGDNNELGTACGKFFQASIITVLDVGDSDIMKTVKDKM